MDTRAIKLQALRLAREVVKNHLRYKGLRPSSFTWQQISKWAQDEIDRDPGSYIETSKTLEDFYQRQAHTIKIDDREIENALKSRS